MRDICVLGGEEVEQAKKMLEVLCPSCSVAICGGKTRRFDMLILTGANECAGNFISALSRSDILLINSDDKSVVELIKNNKAPVITFGLNPKASVTASSVMENEYLTVLCCVQRAFATFTGAVVEPQEFALNITGSAVKTHAALAAVSAALYWDVPPENIDKVTV
jgi:UDP-N-acetylmuramate-alanine ligase